MVCPIFLAKVYPSPVEPVKGYEAPPVHIIAASQAYCSLSVVTPTTRSSFTVIDVTGSFK